MGRGRYFCDYCDTFLTHDSRSVRKTHNNGRKHKENVRYFYQKWVEEKAQSLIDQTTAQYQNKSGVGIQPFGAMVRPIMRPGMPMQRPIAIPPQMMMRAPINPIRPIPPQTAFGFQPGVGVAAPPR